MFQWKKGSVAIKINFETINGICKFPKFAMVTSGSLFLQHGEVVAIRVSQLLFFGTSTDQTRRSIYTTIGSDNSAIA
jgi:hypothetical protein